jgi:hypothetical protein
MSTEPTTAHEHVRALATAVRDGELTPGQRAALAGLLLTVDAATRLAPRVQEYYPGSDAAAVGYLIGNWAPVRDAYAELVAMVASGGEGHAA